MGIYSTSPIIAKNTWKPVQKREYPANYNILFNWLSDGSVRRGRFSVQVEISLNAGASWQTANISTSGGQGEFGQDIDILLIPANSPLNNIRTYRFSPKAGITEFSDVLIKRDGSAKCSKSGFTLDSSQGLYSDGIIRTTYKCSRPFAGNMLIRR
jgi:hypothetical protein